MMTTARRSPMSLQMLMMWLISMAMIHACQAVEEENGGCKPHQVHLTLDSKPSDMVVLWTTQNKDCETKVSYDSGPWNLKQVAVGSSTEWSNSGQNVSFRFLHKVVLESLKPATTYYYRPAGSVTPRPYMFKVPEIGIGGSPSFLVLSGSQATAPEVLKAAKRQGQTGQYSALLYNGIPARHDDKEEEELLSDMSTAATSLPLIATPEQIGASDSSRQLHQFSMPVSDSKLWFSVDIGPVHLISYSTEVLFEKDPTRANAQQAWLVKDLTQANEHRNVTPWIVAMGNQPMYCASGVSSRDDCATNTSKVRHGLEDLFYHFAVDLALESHRLGYQRQWPQYKGVLVAASYSQPSTPVEIVMGSGAGEKAAETVEQPAEVDGGNSSSSTTSTTTENEDWSAFTLGQSDGLYYGSLTVVNATHLHWQLLSATSDALLDEIWLIQENHGNFSLGSLPHNISHQINQTIIAMGGKPGTYDFIQGTGAGDLAPGSDGGLSKYSLWIGLGVVAVVLVLVLGTACLRSYARRKRSRAGRRWRDIDKDGGSAGNFYSVASDSDTDDNDFEIDMYDKSNKQSSKLLTSY